MRIPLLLLPLESSKQMMRGFKGIFDRLGAMNPGIAYDLKYAGLDISAGDYLAGVFPSALIWGLIVYLPLVLAFTLRGELLSFALTKPLPTMAIGLMLFLYYWTYPKILSEKIAQQEEKDLIFVLKDLLLQTSAGVPLYEAVKTVSLSGYGVVSNEFANVIKDVKTGKTLEGGLENLALKTRSSYMRKTLWQLVNGYRSGSNIQAILRDLVQDLTMDQRDKIKSYSQELNMWTLVYMMFAVVAPTIGATMLVVLSTVAGGGVTPNTFVMLVIASFVLQIVLIGFVKSRRPMVRI